MKDLQIISQIINNLDNFKKKKGSTEISYEEFISFLNGSEPRVKSSEPLFLTNLNNILQEDRPETVIAILITYMHRYAKLYARKALVNSPIQSMDEFSYLIILFTYGEMTKSELILRNAHEKSSGMELLKRLITAKLVGQKENESDKRSKVIFITEFGRESVNNLFSDLDDLAKIVSGKLSLEEKNELLRILVKLDNFHFNILTHSKNEDLKSIIRNENLS